uniref:Uncharacterized protein n=2 Tax=Phaeomonas parva TaxID=124430 RepID=A0A7S1UE06_9STRA|mmetsp:Transcript_41832/g.131090  ORF Transcript_41832/g.131090 Transcript_41832/m.131090 type:complete len:607 (+) Transcript_41832:252-2072(+)
MIHGNATQEAVECVPWDEMPAFETEVCQGREICVAVGEDREGECLCNYVLGYERSHEGRCVVTAGYYLNTAWMVGCIVTNVVVVVRVAKVLRRSYDTRTDHRKNATSKFVSVFLWLMMCYAAVALAQFSVYLYTMIAHAHTGTWRSTWDTLLMTGATLFNLSLGMGPLLFTTGLTGSFRSGSLSPSARATGIKSGDQPNTPARPRILNGERLTAAMYMFWATPLLLTLLILPVGILTAAAAMSVYTAVIVGPAFLIIGGKARRSMLDSPDPRVQEHAEIMKTLLWRARIGFTLLATLLVPAGALSGGVAASSALARKITTYTVVALYQIVTGSRAYMAFSMCDYALNLHELAGLFRTSRSDAKAASLTEYTRGVLGIVVEKPAEEKSQRRAARVAPLPGGLSKAEGEDHEDAQLGGGFAFEAREAAQRKEEGSGSASKRSRDSTAMEYKDTQLGGGFAHEARMEAVRRSYSISRSGSKSDKYSDRRNNSGNNIHSSKYSPGRHNSLDEWRRNSLGEWCRSSSDKLRQYSLYELRRNSSGSAASHLQQQQIAKAYADDSIACQLSGSDNASKPGELSKNWANYRYAQVVAGRRGSEFSEGDGPKYFD